MTKERTGFVAIIGRPNVGKSTLLNTILGQKLSITSRKPQTTRHSILGIKTEGRVQTIFVDTPGIHGKTRNYMNRYMNQTARSAIVGVDLILFMIAGTEWQEDDELIAELLQNRETPVFLVINKVDLVKDKAKLLPFVSELKIKVNAQEVIFICALKADTVRELERLIVNYLPEAPHIFANDDFTDKSARFLVEERIREKLTRRLGAELPYAITVQLEAYEEAENIINIAAVIFVERDNQKAIVIGKGGKLIKSVGHDARVELEELLAKKILLKLWVKVRSGWADDKKLLNSLGYTDKDAS